MGDVAHLPTNRLTVVTAALIDQPIASLSSDLMMLAVELMASLYPSTNGTLALFSQNPATCLRVSTMLTIFPACRPIASQGDEEGCADSPGRTAV